MLVSAMRAAALAPSRPTRSAGAAVGLRPANPLRAAVPSSRRAPGGRRLVATQAALLPTSIKLAADWLGAFVVLYCSLSWANLRRVRMQVEKAEKERAAKEADRKARLQKLNGQGGAAASKDGGSGGKGTGPA